MEDVKALKEVEAVVERQALKLLMKKAFKVATAPSVLYKPELSKDGDMWCALYGKDLQEGVAGFGKSPQEAMQDFDRNWEKEIEKKSAPLTFNFDQINYAVNRFLSWELPKDFNPDGGIAYDGRPGIQGTNLFTATQAAKMISHILEGMPKYDEPKPEPKKPHPKIQYPPGVRGS